MAQEFPGVRVKVNKESVYLDPHQRALPTAKKGDEIVIASGPYAENLVKEGDVSYVKGAELVQGLGITGTPTGDVSTIKETGHAVAPAALPPMGDQTQRAVIHQDDGKKAIVDETGATVNARLAAAVEKGQEDREQIGKAREERQKTLQAAAKAGERETRQRREARAESATDTTQRRPESRTEGQKAEK